MITQEQIEEVVRRIVTNVNPEKVILFGSYAYGSPGEDSDLDILVIKDSTLPRHERVKGILRHLRGLKIPIDVVCYTPNEVEHWRETEAAFITQILRKGRVLYERRKQIG